MTNPYEPPQSTDSNPADSQVVMVPEYGMSVTPNCPFCAQAISRFSVWNSLEAKRCPECRAKLSLVMPGWARMLMVILALGSTPITIALLRSGQTWLWVLPVGIVVLLNVAQLIWGCIVGTREVPTSTKSTIQ